MINEFEKGIGIAGYLLSLSIFANMLNKNLLNIEQITQIIDGARNYAQNPEYFVGDPKTLASADAALGAAQGLLLRLATGKSSA